MNAGQAPQRRVNCGRAAMWHTRISRGLTDAERDAFQGWIATPANAREFRAQRALIDGAAELKGDLRAAVIASVTSAQGRARTPVRRLAWTLSISGLAAAVVVAFAAGWLLLRHDGYLTQTYTTRTGQVRNITLPDGSTVSLNSQSELQWVGSPQDRRVRLVRGEAYFQVVHEPTRPFRIIMPHSEVRVLGTRFDVYEMSNGDVRVSVLSGSVGIEGLGSGAHASPSWRQRLTSGEQIEYTPVGLLGNVRQVSAAQVIRWRDGMVETEGETLSAFVSNLSRYTRQRIVIADPRAAEQTVGGAYSVRDIDGTLQRLARIVPITVTHEDGEIVLGYRQSADTKGSRGAGGVAADRKGSR